MLFLFGDMTFCVTNQWSHQTVNSPNSTPAISVLPKCCLCINSSLLTISTGMDPTKDQWMELCKLIQEKKLLPFFDCAYQGFATGDLVTDQQNYLDSNLGLSKPNNKSFSSRLYFNPLIGLFYSNNVYPRIYC